jgi:hypothetical protein
MENRGRVSNQGGFMKKRLSALTGAILLSLFAVTALSSAAAGDYAKGRGTTTQDQFSFMARGTGAGDRADGNWSDSFKLSSGKTATLTGDVTCMLIVGRGASIGGRITSIKPAGAAAAFGNPQGFMVDVTDNAKPSEGLDVYGWFTTAFPPPACGPPGGGGNSVITGDIELTPGTP